MRSFNIKNIIKTCKNIIELEGWSKTTRNVILSLWTSYCIWHIKRPGSNSYDVDLRNLYIGIANMLSSKIAVIDELKTYDNFKKFMSQYVIESD